MPTQIMNFIYDVKTFSLNCGLAHLLQVWNNNDGDTEVIYNF